MLVVMQQNASEQDIETVIGRMVALGFDVHRSSGTMYTVLGGVGDTRKFEEAEFKSMSGVREAIRITSRWKLASKRANPKGTRVRIGAAEVGGEYIADLPGDAVLREIWESSQVRVLSTHADALVVPAQAMSNESLLRELGRAGMSVILKRGDSSSVDDWLYAADMILQAGNKDVLLCESGVRTFFGYALDVGAIAELRLLTHLPVIASPRDVNSQPDIVAALKKAAIAAGAQGILN